MSPTFPPLAALFLTHFHDLSGQEVVYYASMSNEDLPASLIEHASLPSGMHQRSEDLVTFAHHGLPAAGLFRSCTKEGGRGRRMGTLGVVLAPPAAPDAPFDVAPALAELYDRLGGIEDPFDKDAASVSAQARTALLDAVWAHARAGALAATQAQSAKTVAVRLARGVKDTSPVSYMPALLSMLGPALVTVYKASLSGQRVLLYAQPPLLPLEAFAWCIWAMGLPPAAAVTAGARASAWLGQVGLMQLDEVKKRTGGWVATTSDLMYKSHTDAYDLLVDFSDSIPADTEDVRSRGAVPPPTPKLFETAPNSSGGKPTAVPITYAFVDLALYRSLVLLDQSPHSVHAETVGFSATSRTGGMWLVVFEMFERLWHLCVGLCEFTIGRGNVGAIALEDDEHAVLLRVEPADDDDTTTVPDTEADGESDSDAVGGARADVDIDLTEAIRRGRLILDQLHHNAHHLYARLLTTAAGSWELSDDSLRTLTGSSRLSWGGRTASDSRFWLALARTWNVEPTTETETAASASG